MELINIYKYDYKGSLLSDLGFKCLYDAITGNKLVFVHHIFWIFL